MFQFAFIFCYYYEQQIYKKLNLNLDEDESKGKDRRFLDASNNLLNRCQCFLRSEGDQFIEDNELTFPVIRQIVKKLANICEVTE